ncbi:hypothetical protein D3C85_1572530 [compost metagenome]
MHSIKVIILTPDQAIKSVVALFPTKSSAGQLCVYEISELGRSVTVAQVAQKKNAFILCILFASLMAFFGIA